MSDVKNILCRIFIILVSLILLIPFIFTAILSCVDYSVLHGLFGSAWVGFKNIVSFFTAAYFPAVVTNTVIIGVVSLVLGAVYVFISSMAISGTRNPILKGIVATILCIPAIIPLNLFVAIMPTDFLTKPSFLLQTVVAALDGLKTAGLVVVAATFIKNDLKKCIGCTLLYIAIRLIGLFTVDTGLILNIYNPLTYEVLDTISTFTYRTGLFEGNYSYSAGVYITKVFLQLIPAAIACGILIFVFKDNTIPKIQSNHLSPATVVVIVPVLLLIAIIAKGSSLFPTTDNELIKQGYINGTLIAAFSGLFVSLMAICIAMLVRNSGIVGIIAITALCLTYGNTIGEFMMLRSAGLVDTILGVVVHNLSVVAVIALIYAFITMSERNIYKDISVFIVGFVLMFARFWSDSVSPMIILKNREMYPISLIIRQVMIGNGAEGKAFSSMPFIVIPLVVVAVGVFIAILLTNKSKSANAEKVDM